MSASLVGSEMCIRDRCQAGWITFAGPFLSGLGLSFAVPGRGQQCRAPKTVSYTHLTLPTICSV
eukprot:1061030-Alexandrium_andersonii.AAC.1